MRVLVTGGCGFIGSHLTDALFERGDAVTVLDDLSTGLAGRVNPQVTVYRQSIADAAALTGVVQRLRPAVICHLAAQPDVRVSVAAPAADAGINVVGTVNVLEAARAVGARVVFASTGGALYGTTTVSPSPEELTPRPESPYGTAKYCAEQYIGLYNRLYGTGHAVLRLGNVYGPRQDPSGEAGVVAIFCGQILREQRPTVYGDGRQTRDYVYVGDIVEAFLAAIEHGGPGVWNIGTGTPATVLDVLEVIGRIAGRTPEPLFARPRAGELLHSALEVSRATAELKWRTRTSLDEGIAQVYAWAAADSPVRAQR
ncbi:NAD-dependent epimerase/dehydratase family protein [Spongiactinospora sp. TRM90649]|uniref:NAD-dependent epimerase/dehydratase family protein n=1 Tax=Spongiactinospora sp. TRM90649 TaxID=3031114 RepID=UPI0023F8AFA5|nr:NAD-dependent epimerase/dehydratase family protein [Spongiactinospora sp. TRM90649]MDF5753495.1 GDP-mannose 4,6-dehydratase [Spongiactinospora sp. TRM90649]